MFKKEIKYTDYNGIERTEDFYFNLNKAEITEMQMSSNGGLEAMLQRVVKERSGKEIMAIFKEIITRSYGIKTDDGKRFIKNQEVCDAFLQSEAYNELFMELVTDADAAAEFIRKIIPTDLAAEVEKAEKADNK